MSNKLSEIKMSVYHQDCICSETTDKFPEITLKQCSPVTLIKYHTKNKQDSILWAVKAPNKDYLDKYLSCLKNRSDTVRLDILKKTSNTALILHHVKFSTSSYDSVIKKGFIYTEPVHISNGYETHSAITTDKKQMKTLLDELDCIGEIKILKIKDYKEKKNNYNLTNKQINALELAYRNGYYSWPKKANLEKISASYGTTRRGFQEALRKAEAKVIPEIVKEILNNQRFS